MVEMGSNPEQQYATGSLIRIQVLPVEAGGSGQGFLQVIKVDPKARSDGGLPSLTVTHDPAW